MPLLRVPACSLSVLPTAIEMHVSGRKAIEMQEHSTTLL